MEKNFVIRKAGIEDLENLLALGIQTFSETFGPHNSEENLLTYLESKFNIEQLEKELLNPDSVFYLATLAAKDNDAATVSSGEKFVGYLKLNFGQAQTEIREGDGIEIERIYALKEFHGKKIGQRLFETALAVAQERKANYIWLGVWEKNDRAISFYTKNGFVEFDKHIFRLGNDVQTDIMMKKFC